ncbi:hypothetical protein RclHR1_03460019 [Rhizophagus clarus]|uniref:Protein kinase domain-containing protein n=1 Tax=Rhizophagus clarus TaxID=94130 RepID=A0A2Z6RBD9_9GLOM|nr:hypothetical protein RclHR1_03460019 [Rhizophagus clarus]
MEIVFNHKNCSYCNNFFTEESWCKECDPCRVMEGWTSGNPDIDKFIKDTIRKEYRLEYDTYYDTYSYDFLEWVPFNRFTDIKEIGEGGFAKVYSANWIDGKSKVQIKIHWDLSKKVLLRIYGLTKDPETKEFMMIMTFAEKGNLRNFHSGNILHTDSSSNTHISDFGLSGPADEQKSDDEVYGVMPYIAPEVLNGEPYTSSSDIYSFGVVMAELSSGKPPFYNKKHDLSLALAICNGLRPEFGKGTPEFYKKLAYKCMNVNSNERPIAGELENIFWFWDDSNNVIMMKKKNLAIKEMKLEQHLKKPIKKYQTS